MENKRKRARHRYRRFSGSRGTITVFVTLIMIPVILLNAFIVDMARVKLYGNQAVMVADNCAEAALTNYDNLLKEMYGLFAMSQDENAIAALNQIEEFVKYSSFNPNSNTILGETYDGFMPYSTAELQFGDFVFPEGANLGNDAVLQTQIGDFMRFRIVQESMQAMNGASLDDAMKLLDVLDQASDQDEDSKIIDKKVEFDNAVSNLYVKLYEYYMFMYGYARYPAYLDGVNQEIDRIVSECKSIYDSDTVRTYYEYAGLSEEERSDLKWLLYNPVTEGYRIRNSIYECRDDFSDKFYDAVYISDDIFKNAELLKDHDVSLSYPRRHPRSYVGWYIGDIRDFGDDFIQIADELDAAITRYEQAKANIETVLAAKDTRDPFRTKIEKDMEDLEGFIGIFNGTGCGYTREDFTNLPRYLYDNALRDIQYETDFKDIVDVFERLGDCMQNAEEVNWDELSSMRINYDNYMNFTDITSYNNLYEKLSLEFKNIGTEEKKKFEERKDKAKEESDKKVEKFNNESFPEARDVPAGFTVSANSGGSGVFDPISSIKEVASYFSGSLSDGSVRFMLKYYTISYDFGMFSSRVSKELAGKPENEVDGKDVVFESLTGVTYDGNANYLYGAELEYILAGYQSSLENLKTSRNMIVGFRTIMNYKCTYTIDSLNNAFCLVRDAGNGIFPGLGYIVEQALRLSVTIIETTSDWEELKKGGSVMFNKTQIGDLWIAGTITSFLNPDELKDADTTTKSQGLKLSYNQYLRIMIMLLESNDVVLERTRDLITLNMNLVATEDVGANGVLTKQIFFADKAYTAVSVDCSVHSDFAVMPQSFLNQLAGPDTATEINDFGSSFFKFTVVRGY